MNPVRGLTTLAGFNRNMKQTSNGVNKNLTSLLLNLLLLGHNPGRFLIKDKV